MKPNIFPVMRYADAPASMDWLVRAFGFEKQAEHPGPDGAVVHAELRIGASAIMVSSATPPVASNPWSGVLQGVYVTLQEVDAHHDRARAAGAEIVIPLYDTAYGSREYAARDLEGHLWGFGTYSPESGDGEPDLFPELRCRTPAAIGWLTRAFGFRPTAEIPGPDGAIVHAEMRLGDGTVMLGIGTGDGQCERPAPGRERAAR